MNRNIRFIVSVLLLLGVIFTACAPAPAAAPAGDTQPAKSSTADEEYIYVSCMGNLEFFNAHKYGWKWPGSTGREDHLRWPG